MLILTKIATTWECDSSHFLLVGRGECRRSWTEGWHLPGGLAWSGVPWRLSGGINLRVSALAWGGMGEDALRAAPSLPLHPLNAGYCPIARGIFS